MSKPIKKKVFGLMAEYETPKGIFHACEKVRDAGYQKWDSYTPFPVHNLDKAMGLPPSILGWIVFICESMTCLNILHTQNGNYITCLSST